MNNRDYNKKPKKEYVKHNGHFHRNTSHWYNIRREYTERMERNKFFSKNKSSSFRMSDHAKQRFKERLGKIDYHRYNEFTIENPNRKKYPNQDLKIVHSDSGNTVFAIDRYSNTCCTVMTKHSIKGLTGVVSNLINDLGTYYKQKDLSVNIKNHEKPRHMRDFEFALKLLGYEASNREEFEKSSERIKKECAEQKCSLTENGYGGNGNRPMVEEPK